MSDYFLADDLSGAMDAAAAFHRAGKRVVVVLSPEAWTTSTAADVVGITTESRNASAAGAAAAVRAAIAQGQARGATLRYKKIDSTLRGQIAAELAALASALPGARFLFSPANPRVGRTVRNGHLLVHGVPVSETEFARDPLSPVRESSIRTIIGAVDAEIDMADAESESDLQAAVDRMQRGNGPWVAIGSGALAVPVAALNGTAIHAMSSADREPEPGPTLFICGSAHRANREQAVEWERVCGIPVHRVDPAEPELAVRGTMDDIQRNGTAGLMITPERTESARALQAISTAACAVIQQSGAARIFVTGGETAFAVARQLGVEAFEFRAELEPGLSLSNSLTSGGSMRWAIKPGGFGDRQTWVRAYHALRA